MPAHFCSFLMIPRIHRIGVLIFIAEWIDYRSRYCYPPKGWIKSHFSVTVIGRRTRETKTGKLHPPGWRSSLGIFFFFPSPSLFHRYALGRKFLARPVIVEIDLSPAHWFHLHFTRVVCLRSFGLIGQLDYLIIYFLPFSFALRTFNVLRFIDSLLR